MPREHIVLQGFLAAAAVASGLVFLGLADGVAAAGAQVQLDLALGSAVHRSVATWPLDGIRVFTWLGGGWGLTSLCIAVAAMLFRRGLRVQAIGWIVAMAGVGVLNTALKAAYARPRPTLDPPLAVASGWSFPSGHSMGTFVAAGMLVYLLLVSGRGKARRWLFVAAAMTWTVAMGFSRICLGVHYLSDVVSGFAAGAVWLVACVSVLEIVRRSAAREVSAPPPAPPADA